MQCSQTLGDADLMDIHIFGKLAPKEVSHFNQGKGFFDPISNPVFGVGGARQHSDT
jgi:hypothetical protein